MHLVSYGVCAPGIGDCKQLMHDECCPYSLVCGLASLLTTTTFQMGLSPSYVVTSPLQSTENDEVNLCLFSLKPITYPCLQLLCQNNIRKSYWETSEAGRQKKKNSFDEFRDAQIYLTIKMASESSVRYWGHSFHSLYLRSREDQYVTLIPMRMNLPGSNGLSSAVQVSGIQRSISTGSVFGVSPIG